MCTESAVVFGGTELDVDLVVTIPRVTGPAIPGVPAGPGWFVPIDDYCRVEDTDGRVFAAGDATACPVKHGGLATQQADTAAAGIAHLAGVVGRPTPFSPVIRAMLLTGDRPRMQGPGRAACWAQGDRHEELRAEPGPADARKRAGT